MIELMKAKERENIMQQEELKQVIKFKENEVERVE